MLSRVKFGVLLGRASLVESTRSSLLVKRLTIASTSHHSPVPIPSTSTAPASAHDPSIPPRALQEPAILPRTHNIPVALLHFRSHSTGLLALFIHFVMHSAYAMQIPLSRPSFLPTQRSLWTVLKGPFVHKKSQENFERLVHKRVIKVWDTNPEVLDLWVRYLEENALGGVGMRIVEWQREEIGFGKKRLDHVGERLERSETTRATVKDLGDKIVKAEEDARVKAKESPTEAPGKTKDVTTTPT